MAERSEMARRLDAFVDAAFAFAVTLLIVGGSDIPTDFDALRTALGRVPSFAASFALICMFWLGYRDVGRLWSERDALSTTLSLGIVFLVLVYVFPLRIMVESAFHALSGGRLPGQGLAGSAADMRFLYTSYGLGFLLLASLFASLYAHHLRKGHPDGKALSDGRAWLANWLIMTGVATVSLVAALFAPGPIIGWLPGVIYMLIPLGIGISEYRHIVEARRAATADASTA
jgi:uncharacterized membrane protein